MTSGVYPRTEEHKIKMSESKKGEKNPMFGKHLKFSEETRKKISEGNTGKIHSKETRKKIAESSKGRIFSEEHRRKLGEAEKGEKNYFFGKHFSEEHRKKIKEKRKFLIVPFKDTKPEIKLQEALTAKNIIFEKHKTITGQPDIFIEPNICIFVDGCFWHNCPIHFNLENKYTIAGKKRGEYVNKTLSENGYKVQRF